MPIYLGQVPIPVQEITEGLDKGGEFHAGLSTVLNYLYGLDSVPED